MKKKFKAHNLFYGLKTGFKHIIKLVSIFLLLFPLNLLAQNNETTGNPVTIKGIVKDSNENLPVPGASVVIKGTSIGTVTNVEGNFEIKTNIGATLVFSYVGMKTQELMVNSATELNIILEEDVLNLEEVIVVGYGTVERKQITSAVTNISEEDFNEGYSSEPLSVLEGKVAGLTLSKPYGADPNESAKIMLRGITSIKGTTEPLIIIDGIPASMSTIDENDIANVSVLKDGSASAIYGTRATNGVIIITTKSGQKGEPVLEYDATFSNRNISKELDVLSAEEFINLRNQYANISGSDNRNFGGSTDWLDAIVNENNFEQQHSFALSGGLGNGNYRVTLNVQDAEDLVKRAYKEKIHSRAKIVQHSIKGKLKTQILLSYSRTDRRSANHDDFSRALRLNPTYPLYNSDGTYYFPEANADDKNTLADIMQTEKEDRWRTFNGSIKNDFSILDGLTASLTLGTQQISRWNGTQYSRYGEYAQQEGKEGIVTKGGSHWYDKNLLTTVDYKKMYGLHNINMLVGYSWEEKLYDTMSMTNSDYDSDTYGFYNIGPGTDLQDGDANMSSSRTKETLIGFVGRMVYSYNAKYILTVAVRRDGSSKFGKDNKWGTFPSISVGWNLGSEDFISNLGIFDQLKIRLGYGETGNAGISPYRSLQVLDSWRYYYKGETYTTHGPEVDPNPDLRWETKKETNLGIDFSVLKSRLNGKIDIFQRKTEDLLNDYNVPSPPYFFGRLYANGGTFESKGIEMALHGQIFHKNKFSWDGSFTFTYMQNELTSLSSDKFKADQDYFDEYQLSTGQYLFRYKEGSQLGDFYGYLYDGVDENGIVQYKDVDGDGLTGSGDPDDRVTIGNGIPDYTLSFNTTLRYGNFDLTMLFRGMFGYDIANYKRFTRANPMQLIDNGNNVYADTFEGELGQSRDRGMLFTDEFVEKGNFLKLDRLVIGYNIPVKKVNFISKARLYASVNNVFTITNYSGLDPEVGSQESEDISDGLLAGVDPVSYYPTTRIFSLGLSVKF